MLRFDFAGDVRLCWLGWLEGGELSPAGATQTVGGVTLMVRDPNYDPSLIGCLMMDEKVRTSSTSVSSVHYRTITSVYQARYPERS